MLKEIKLSKQRVEEINNSLKNVHVVTIGDICLDYYAYADMKISELSRETPHHPLPIVKEVFALGGGGNVVNNINTLRVGKLTPVSIIGNDWRGFIVEKYLNDNGFDTSHIIKSNDFTTTCYLKPMRTGISKVVYEDPRLDFENRSTLNIEDEERLINQIDDACRDCDVIAVSDQVRCGIVTARVRERINYWAKYKKVIVDSRDHASDYDGVIVKPNEVEAAIIIGKDISNLNLTIDDYAQIGKQLHEKNKCPAIVTLGELGALWCDDDGETLAPTIKATGEIDICGAGDTFLSALASAYGAGASGAEAIAYGNIASGVTIKKIGMTGTASQEEILNKFKEYYEHD